MMAARFLFGIAILANEIVRDGPFAEPFAVLGPMCLGVPGLLIDTFEEHGLRMGRVRFGGIERAVCLETLPDAAPGEHVLVHVGFALARIDEAEAARLLALFAGEDELGASE